MYTEAKKIITAIMQHDVLTIQPGVFIRFHEMQPAMLLEGAVVSTDGNLFVYNWDGTMHQVEEKDTVILEPLLRRLRIIEKHYIGAEVTGLLVQPAEIPNTLIASTL